MRVLLVEAFRLFSRFSIIMHIFAAVYKGILEVESTGDDIENKVEAL